MNLKKYLQILLFFVGLLIFMGSAFLGYFVGLRNSNELPTNRPMAKSVPKINESIQVKPPLSRGYHFAFFNKPDFFDQSFKAVADLDIKQNPQIKAIIVNHHLLAKELIAQIFGFIAADKPLTVVLLSPNHFGRGNGEILTSVYDWQTPYGILQSDLESIDVLIKNNLIKIDEDPFQLEHGVTNLVGFIKKVLPNAKIIPIIVKESASAEKIDELAARLNKNLPADAIMIGSFDFSHYLPKVVADFHDSLSKTVLEQFDSENTSLLEVDSKAGLQTIIKFAKLGGAKSFTTVNHANAADIIGDKNMAETTSYITGYFSPAENVTEPTATILSLGDIMLDRFVRKALEKRSVDYPFANLERFLSGSDIIQANLEGPVTDFKPKALDPNNTSFTFNPDFIPTLKKVGFNMFGLANNHTFDRAKDGFDQTKNYLTANDLQFFGDPGNMDNISLIKEIRGLKIALVGYSELRNKNFDNITNEVKNLRDKVDFILVFPHWGIEYQLNFSKGQQDKAHQLIEAGADVIVGTHPHVIQPIEIYQNKLIFYSLGNFLFDQTFSQATQTGLGVGLELSKNQIVAHLFPNQINNFQISLLNGEKKDIVLRNVAEKSVGEDSLKEAIKKGIIVIKD